MSLVSSSASKNKGGGSNGAYSDMYALHERGESQSEPEQGMLFFPKSKGPFRETTTTVVAPMFVEDGLVALGVNKNDVI